MGDPPLTIAIVKDRPEVMANPKPDPNRSSYKQTQKIKRDRLDQIYTL
jgi:hypothetical protein